ncbi:MAG: hypothetical protein WC634_01805 [archaeon]
MANARRFDPKRAPAGQVKARVNSACRDLVRTVAGGDIKKVNMNMVTNAATRQGLSVSDLVGRLRSLGAKI